MNCDFFSTFAGEMDIRKYKAALFDMDGVLYDSMKNHATAWCATMSDYGINMTREDAFALEGMRGIDTILHVARLNGRDDITAEEAQLMYNEKTRRYTALARGGSSLIPHVKDLQRLLLSLGLKVGVVTGSGQPTLLGGLRRDFEGLVSPDIIVSALDVSHGKPHPEPYLQGMKKAGSTPDTTIVIENAPLGVKAAKAAGCYCIAVNTGPLPDSVLLSAGADEVFPDMLAAIEAVNSSK